VPLQDLRAQQVLVVPQQPHLSGNIPMVAPWQQLQPTAAVNPYQFQRGLTIPHQSAR